VFSSISIVVPVYNSSSSIEELYSRLLVQLQMLCKSYEIIFVDDCSKDNSFELMKEIYKKDSKVKIIKLKSNYGQQNSIMCALKYVSCDYVITIDDDLQHPPEEIPNLLNKIMEGYDAVFGVPIKKENYIIRNLGSKMTDLLFNLLLSKPKDIKVTSFRIIKKYIVDEMIKDKSTFVYISALMLRTTKNVARVYVKHNHRKYGSSNYNIWKLLKLYINICIYYSSGPLKIFKLNRLQYEIEYLGL
jgi:glycosyltransferase involved in cell wall biosynthesis